MTQMKNMQKTHKTQKKMKNTDLFSETEILANWDLDLFSKEVHIV